MKKPQLFLTFTILLLSVSLLAQPPIVSHPWLYGGSLDEGFTAVEPSLDGGCIAVGFTKSTDFDAAGNKGSSDFFIIKIGSGEQLIWKKTFGGIGIEEATAVRQTLDSGYLVVGFTNGSNNTGDVGATKGTMDAWVLKLNQQGNVVWKRNYGGSKDDAFSDLALTADGGFIAVGYTKSNDGDVTNNHSTNADAWVVKCQADGNILWQKTYGGTESETFNKIVKSGSDWVVVGCTDSSNGDIVQSKGLQDGWVLRLTDTEGGIVWKKNYGGANPDKFRSVKTHRQDNNDVLILAGSSSSNDGDVANTHGGFDAWLMQLNATTGEILWSKLYGGTQIEEFNDLIYDTEKNSYFVVGYTESSDGDAAKNYGLAGEGDAWFIRIKTTGAFEAAYKLGTTKKDNALSVYKKKSSSDGYVAVGSVAFSDGYFSGITYRGGSDGAIFRPVTLTKTEETTLTTPLSISPNPADETITVSFEMRTENSELFDKLSIIDIFGKVVYTQPLSDLPCVFQTKNFSNGVYFLSLEKENQVIGIQKCVIQH